VVEVQANKQIGVTQLKRALARAIEAPDAIVRESPLPAGFQRETARLQAAWEAAPPSAHNGRPPLPPYLAERLLLDTSGYLQRALGLSGSSHAALEELLAARKRLAAAGCPVPGVEAQARYGWVAGVLAGVIAHPPRRVTTRGDRIDRLLTHKLFGTAVFASAMLLVFSSVFVFADPAMKLVDAAVGAIGDFIAARLPAGPLESLVVDGVIGGVGSVLVFLPQILLLFFFLAVLEDCGYMARAAYLMDRLMVRVGLSGKSFIPLLSSFACAI